MSTSDWRCRASCRRRPTSSTSATPRILIADDVADTGHTLRSVQQFCEGKVAEVRTAVLTRRATASCKCDYVWKRTDKWINFPWSDKEPVAKRAWSVKDA